MTDNPYDDDMWDVPEPYPAGQPLRNKLINFSVADRDTLNLFIEVFTLAELALGDERLMEEADIDEEFVTEMLAWIRDQHLRFANTLKQQEAF